MPEAGLERAWGYRLAPQNRPTFAATCDAFPFASTLQKLPSALLRFNTGDLPDNKISIGIHDLEITGLGSFASHNPHDTHAMEGGVIENLVLVIAPRYALEIEAEDC